MRFSPPRSDQIATRSGRRSHEQGFVVIEGLLSDDDLGEIRRELEPHLASDPCGRNNFEGHRTQRVYSLVGKGAIFEDLAEHPAHPRSLRRAAAAELPPHRFAGDLHSSRRDAAAVSQRRLVLPDPTPAPGDQRQHDLGGRRVHRRQRRDAGHPGQPPLERCRNWEAFSATDDFTTAARDERTPKPAPPLPAKWKAR